MYSDLSIEQLKTIAARALRGYHSVAEGYNCGAAITQHISASARNYAREFDEAMDQLAKLDPACPAMRLTVRS